MNKTKIDWCDSTVNPVVGCPNGCAYCYAKRINNRFGYVENWDCPEFKSAALKKFNAKTSRAVFIDSMSDIGHWRPEWMVQILQAMANNPQHDYIALTKTSLAELNEKIGAETGNRKGKVTPDAAWVRDLVKQADAAEIRVFMKESLRSIMGDDFRQDRLLWTRTLRDEKTTNKKGDKKQ